MVLPAVNRRGRPIVIRVVGSILNDTHGSASGAILLMEQDGQDNHDAPSPELSEDHHGQAHLGTSDCR